MLVRARTRLNDGDTFGLLEGASSSRRQLDPCCPHGETPEGLWEDCSLSMTLRESPEATKCVTQPFGLLPLVLTLDLHSPPSLMDG